MAQAPWLKLHGSSLATPLFRGLSLTIPLFHAAGLEVGRDSPGIFSVFPNILPVFSKYSQIFPRIFQVLGVKGGLLISTALALLMSTGEFIKPW